MMRLNMKMIEMLEEEGGLFPVAHALAAQQDPALACLQRLLRDAIAPLMEMGAVEETKDGQRRVDMVGLKQFFFGVLRWPPDVFAAAMPDDLCVAWKGHALSSGLRRSLTTARFLREMAARFPDANRGVKI